MRANGRRTAFGNSPPTRHRLWGEPWPPVGDKPPNIGWVLYDILVQR